MAAGLVFSACTPTPTPSAAPVPTSGPTTRPTAPPSAAPTPRTGGTIYLLREGEQFDQLDPQRVYSGDDLAFLGATLYRSLESYAYSADPVEGTSLTPDLATDLGRPTDGGRTWQFTLREGVTFQTGDPITCEDLRYGVSRTFATDVINQGPTYAIVYLDIPFDEAGQRSLYPGPYVATPAQQALFDKAVGCSADHRTITFHLNRPVADFNYTTTIGFSPVPKTADSGRTYGTTPESVPVSSGPYKVESYATGSNGKLVLVRNLEWNPSSDPVRRAYPDRWEVEMGIDPAVIDQRLIAATGTDAFALQYDQLGEARVRAVFQDPVTPTPALTSRAVSGFDPYAGYLWINVQRVPNVKIRQAMMVALDRDAIRTSFGGEFHGSFADGVVKPTVGLDYAPTGIWDRFFGQSVPSSGDPELASRLIQESGVTPPTLAFDAPDTPINRQMVAVVIASLGRAGITVEYKPACPAGTYCSIISYQDRGDFGLTVWRADWPNASTVIPPLFKKRGGWDLSTVDDAAVDAAIDDAFTTLDRGAQADKWQKLNRLAVENAWVIPTFFSRSYRLAGTNVGPIYQWPTYSSWPYGEMFVTP